MRVNENEAPNILWIETPENQAWPEKWIDLVTPEMISYWINELEPQILEKDYSRNYAELSLPGP